MVNGRFLRARPTGLHRVGRALLGAARQAGLDLCVLAPAGVRDPLVDAWLASPGVGGGLGDHVFEQAQLPRAARGHLLLSVANTAPLAAARGVVVVHDLAPLVEPRWFVPSMRLYAAAVVAAARRARAVCTVSSPVAGELAARGVDPARIHLVRPAVDRRGPAAAADVATERARLGLAGPYALLVGAADPRKDLPTALAAHARVRIQRPHTLVLAGGGHRTFAPVAREAAVDVVDAGYLPDARLHALLTGATVLLYPSRYEGFGLPPLEAWDAGTPALLSDLPALREATGGAGEYLPVGDVAAWADALARVLDAPGPVPDPPAWTWAQAAQALAEALAQASRT